LIKNIADFIRVLFACFFSTFLEESLAKNFRFFEKAWQRTLVKNNALAIASECFYPSSFFLLFLRKKK
jgi:hypothetical protein